MKEVMKVKEVEKVEEAKEEDRRVAAFFDLDGTLAALPSLERRFIRMLRYRRVIPVRNYFLWLGEAMRLLPRGISTILQGNKMYLRGVQSFNERGGRDDAVFPRHKSGHLAKGQAPAPPGRNPRLSVPPFFAEAMERVVWHAGKGHSIVLVSGTLQPLAQDAARAMEAELAWRGIAVRIWVCATRLEEVDGRWTGRILGEAMFGEAKARAVKRLAEEMRLDLERCYAYGDNLNDLGLLATVGRPAAVNPSRRLASIARKRGWLVVLWNERKNVTQSAPRAQRSRRREDFARECEDETPKEASSEKRSEPLMSRAVVREAKSGS